MYWIKVCRARHRKYRLQNPKCANTPRGDENPSLQQKGHSIRPHDRAIRRGRVDGGSRRGALDSVVSSCLNRRPCTATGGVSSTGSVLSSFNERVKSSKISHTSQSVESVDTAESIGGLTFVGCSPCGTLIITSEILQDRDPATVSQVTRITNSDFSITSDVGVLMGTTLSDFVGVRGLLSMLLISTLKY